MNGLGVALPYWSDRPATEALQIARSAADAELDELWVGEMDTFDGFALAGALARETDRIRLTVGPLPVGVRSPAALALGVASVAALGERPADIALGLSNRIVVDDFHGRPFSRMVRALGETIDAMKPVLAGERSDFAGTMVHTKGFRLRTDPPGSRIVVGGFGPQVLDVAARKADRVVLIHVTPAQVAAITERLEKAARDAGRPAPGVVVWMMAALGDDPASLDQMSRNLVIYLRQPSYRQSFVDAGFGDLVELSRGGARPSEVLAAIPGEFVDHLAPFGPPETVHARITAHRDAGAEAVCILPSTAHDPGGAGLLGALAAARRTNGGVA
jgi:probable F420-dependent oxidoreductase